jgi:hypothetical protein
MRLPTALALFVLAILIAQLLAACDLDEARSSKATGEKVGEVHHVSNDDEEPVEEEPVEEEPVDESVCWGDISYQQWLENDCPGDAPPGGP